MGIKWAFVDTSDVVGFSPWIKGKSPEVAGFRLVLLLNSFSAYLPRDTYQSTLYWFYPSRHSATKGTLQLLPW